MSFTDFLGFMISNPWIFLIIGIVASGLIIYQIILFNKMHKEGKLGALNIIIGLIIAINTIIFVLLFWTFTVYNVGDVEPVWILLIIIFLIAGPIIATIFVTIGIRQLSESRIKIVSKVSKHQQKEFPSF